MRRVISRVALAALVLQAGCSGAARDARAPHSDSEYLHTAAQQLTRVIVYDIFSPPQASRVYAYASVAAYEALRQNRPEYRTLAGQLNGLTAVPASPRDAEVSLPLAGVHAFMTVGRALTFSRARMDSLRAAMNERIRAGGMSDAVYERSIAYGDTVAKHVLAWAARDSYIQTRGYAKYTVTPASGRWVPTPPAYMDAVEPHWGMVRPFVMDSASQFKPPPPPPFDTATGSPYRAMVQDVVTSTARLTDEQRAIAAFWDCNPYVMHVQGHAMYATKKITPGGHWMEIVTIASRQAGADLMQSADAYARTSLALADAFIGAWEEKYRSSVIRPETVINTYLDEQWAPLLQTPPFPEYPSGHSVISTAAAEVLSAVYGKNFAFIDSAEVVYGLPARSFVSFEAAAAEAAISRMYGGIHFRPAIDEGIVMGRKVGALVNARVKTRDAGASVKRSAASAARPASGSGGP